MTRIRKFSVIKYKKTNLPPKGAKVRIKPPKKPPPPPETRFQLIHHPHFSFPQSCRWKIVFPSTKEGNAFKNNNSVVFPVDIPIQQMKDQVNMAIYREWSYSQKYNLKNLYAEKDFYSDRIMRIGVVVLCFFVFPVLLQVHVEEMINILEVCCLIITVFCVLNSFYSMPHELPYYEYDEATKESIKEVLAKFNDKEEVDSGGQPRFQWTCDDDCVWIAIEIFNRKKWEENLRKLVVNSYKTIEEVSQVQQTSRVKEESDISQSGDEDEEEESHEEENVLRIVKRDIYVKYEIIEEDIRSEEIKEQQIKSEEMKEESIKEESIKEESIKEELIKREQVKEGEVINKVNKEVIELQIQDIQST